MKLKNWTLLTCGTTLLLTMISIFAEELTNIKTPVFNRIVAFLYLPSYLLFCTYSIRRSIQFLENKENKKGTLALSLSLIVFYNPITFFILLWAFTYSVLGQQLVA